MACNQSASSGGISTFADGRSILLDINKRDPSIAKLLVEAPSCIFKDTENTYVGPMFESMAENRLALRFRYDSGGYFSSELSDKLPLILEALRRHTRQCLLEKGEGVLLNNRRWLHGRTAFTGSRVVWRVLAHRPSLDGFRISNP
jgi:hypothetical protein